MLLIWANPCLLFFCLITICLSISRSKRECLSCSKLIQYHLWILKEHNNFSYLWKFSFGEIYLEKPKNLQKFAQIKRIQVSGIREKSRIQENFPCGIRNIAQEIRNPTRDWTPESKFHWQRLESSTWNPESTTVLDPIAWSVSSLTFFASQQFRSFWFTPIYFVIDCKELKIAQAVQINQLFQFLNLIWING